MRSHAAKFLIPVLAALSLLGALPSPGAADINATFLYSLANFHGKVPYSNVRVRVDRSHDETYVIDRGIVRVFNENGMEIHWFGDDPELGGIHDLAVDEKGDLFLLTIDQTIPDDPKYLLVRCNYRGEVKEKHAITGMPSGFERFFPTYLLHRDGEFYFLSNSQMKLVVTDRKGVFRRGYDLGEIVDVPEKDRPNTEIFGFNLDSEGNMLFTVPTQFQAYVVSPDGKVAGAFGKSGSAPGMFGIVSGIARDDRGNYLVVERLRSVVMIFDKEYRFLKEFGYRGDKPGNMTRPNEVAVGNDGKLYVTQLRNQGVSVFSVTGN